VLLAIKDKDEKVMAYVISKYSKLLWKVVSAVLTKVGTVQDIEECVADVFIQFWLNPEKYNAKRAKLSSYLSMLARSRAIDRYRKIVAKKESILEENIIYKKEILEEIVSKEQKEKLMRCIQKLSDVDKEIIMRRFFYNQKPKEIAVALGVTGKQVENRLYLTKQKLRKMMEE